uniref:Uncharacterized protein n=1 Tax=Noctiluca scintillans TaxID=2966 RepID=A0A7S1B0V9_NOCSC|mmetsp:Transcript_782/g.2241  ORF Transcript_782/g.2241 Transcript_782/m.2241 type:complete len:122 (+) Transcript_782:54-419(+)|eukprot:CAMPEP_0194483560 /NCGR_PEP_ID=MMETSP0253-20130528/5120_1 /TAXON_ID=2966 /ORGANISM="Noctiluca scintillans" /LENGTH=121 /DNA_ID=CAMNT_0039323229 /DNA_START=48 /DNA_END=413 /DNA_ORIENTATION=-
MSFRIIVASVLVFSVATEPRSTGFLSVDVSNPMEQLKSTVMASKAFQLQAAQLSDAMGCSMAKKSNDCDKYVEELTFCLALANKLGSFHSVEGSGAEVSFCKHVDDKMPSLSLMSASINGQ